VTTPASVGAIVLVTFTTFNKEFATPIALDCTVEEQAEGVTLQSCPANDLPGIRGDVLTYRGRAIGGEFRSSNFAVCSQLYGGMVVELGRVEGNSVMGATWSEDPLRFEWHYDGSACVFKLSSTVDPKPLIDILIDGAPDSDEKTKGENVPEVVEALQ
jgi:hypothetical protein